MLNKKLGLLVLAAAAMGLVACGGNSSPAQSSSKPADTSHPTGLSSDPGSQPAGEEPIPQVDGKIGVYFHFADSENVKLANLPSYVSPWITGNWNGYAQTAEGGAIEMQRKADTDIFYGYIPGDGNLGDLGYQITLGYNSASGVASSLQGIDWNYKTNWSADNYGGLDHPFMTKVNDHLYVCKADTVDSLDFKAVLPEPIMVKNQAFKFRVTDAVKTAMADKNNLEICVKGGFNGWTPVSAGAPDNDGYYTVNLTEGDKEMVLGTVEMCIGIRNKLIGGMEDKYNLALQPAGELDDYDAGGGVEEADGEVYKISNIKLTMSKLYQTAHTYNIGIITLPVHANGTADAYALPSNEAPLMEHNIVITVKNTSETAVAMADGRFMSIAGAFTGDWAGTWPHDHMTEVVPGKEYRYVIEMGENLRAGVDLGFKIADGAWGTDEIGADSADGNIHIVPENGKAAYKIEADLSGFGSGVGDRHQLKVELAEDELALDKDIHVLVQNTGEGTVGTVTAAGDFQGWDPAATPLTAVGNNYAFTIAKGTLKAGDQIKFKLTNGTWDKNIGNGNDNFVVYLPFGLDLLNLKGDIAGFTGDIELVSWGTYEN